MNSTIRIRAAVSAAALALTLPVSAAAQKPRSSDTPVTSVISDYDSGMAPSLQIQSDQKGAYENSSTLRSVIMSNGQWALDSYYVKGATRTVYLRFDQPISGTGPNGGEPVSPPSGFYEARIGSECWRAPYNGSFLTLPPGQTMACPMNVHFDYGGKTYDLHMSQFNANFPETNYVNVTCIYPTSGSGPCSQWRITPSATYYQPDGTTGYRNIANLSYETTLKGSLVYVKQGDFFVSFLIIVSNP